MVIYLSLFSLLVLIPIGLSTWCAAGRPTTRIDAVLMASWLGAYVWTAVTLVPGWNWISVWWWPATVLVVGVAASIGVWRSKTVEWWPERRWRSIAKTAGHVFLLLFFGSSVPEIFLTRDYEPEPVRLANPFGEGRFHVGHGGSLESTNYHVVVPAQSHALDITQLNGLGMRARGAYPTELEKYAVFETPLMAPCSGEVVLVDDAHVDQTPPTMDPEHPAGNVVAIACEGVTVVLAHMKQGSVKVGQGDAVKTGQIIGFVGNSGNTSEPHLHIHAVRGTVRDHEELLYRGAGVPMLIGADERYLVRNDIFGGE